MNVYKNFFEIRRPPTQKPVAIRKRASKLDEILSKRPKLTVMKKTQLDWAKHKKEEKIDGELEKFARSKDSLYEKRAFLNRTDFRTFELERDERLKRINNRKQS